RPDPDGAVVAITLFAGGTRTLDTGPIPTLLLSPAAREARLELVADPGGYAWYRLALRQAGGPEIASLDRVQPRIEGSRASFAMTVPATALAAGDYVVTLRGVLATGEADDVGRMLLRI